MNFCAQRSEASSGIAADKIEELLKSAAIVDELFSHMARKF